MGQMRIGWDSGRGSKVEALVNPKFGLWIYVDTGEVIGALLRIGIPMGNNWVHGNRDTQSKRDSKENADQDRGSRALWAIRQTLSDRMSGTVRPFCKRGCSMGRARLGCVD